jgi:hypothetical protein
VLVLVLVVGFSDKNDKSCIISENVESAKVEIEGFVGAFL